MRSKFVCACVLGITALPAHADDCPSWRGINRDGMTSETELLKITADNQVEQIYDNKKVKNHHGGVILADQHPYGYSDGVGWVCQNMATGDIVWNEKNKLGKRAVGYADGMLYCLSETDGTCVFARATTDGWSEHGRFELDPQTQQRSIKAQVWTHPVIANGR